jgi:hypothetical protein
MPDFITIDTSDLEQFANSTLPKIRAAMHIARRAVMNNMAFGVRQEALEHGIPEVMTVRNPNILRATLRVNKAVRSLGADEKATLGMTTRDRFGGLLEEELGGHMMRPPATLAARGGDKEHVIQQRARLKDKNQFVTPDDLDIANDTGNYTQRIAAMISAMERNVRGSQSKPFIIHGHPSLPAGLYMLGKKKPKPGHPNARKLVTLRTFHGERVDVKRRRWLRPSIDRWLATHSRETEWKKALEFALLKVKR